MVEVLIVITTVFVCLLILVAGSCFFPGLKFLQEVKKWQTLIGSVLGFGGVAVAILFQHNFELKREERDLNKYEANLLSSISTELILIKGELEGHASLAYEANKNFDLELIPRCESIFKVLSGEKISNISVSGILHDLNGRVSPQTYSLVFQAVEARKMLDSVLNVPMSERCEKFSADSAVDLYVKLITDQLPFMNMLLSAMNTRAESLR